MSELQDSSEIAGKVTVHSGTTKENFLQCAVVLEDTIHFDKSRLPQHYFDSIFFVPALEGGVRYAHELARELGQEPLIIAGEVDVKDEYKYELASGETMRVKGIWRLREGINWRNVNPFVLEEIIKSYQHLSGDELLKFIQHNEDQSH